MQANYKKGSYNKGFNPPRQNNVLAQVQRNQRAAVNKAIAARGMAPLSNRGFGSMALGINRERKFFDIDTATYQANTTGSFTLLYVPILGSDFTNRIGRKTIVKSTYIRGRVLLEALNNQFATVTVAALQARMIVFIDNQPNGAAPAVTDLLKEAVPSSQLNANNRDRFRIIKDKTYVFDGFVNVTTATQSQAAFNRNIYDIKCFKKLNIETIFNGTNGGTIGDINTGALYMFWISNTIAGANIDVNAVVSIRSRFDDS